MLPHKGHIKDYLREQLQVDFAMPTVEVRIWNNQTLTGTPRVLHNVKDLFWDRREDALATEISFTIENTDGTKSPHYDPKKFPHLPELERSGYQYALYPENKVEVWLGYGEERIQIFTGIIDKVKIDADTSELEVTARDNMKYLIDQAIVPDDEKQLIYKPDPEEPLLISAIIADMINKAGVLAEVEETLFEDGSSYTIDTELTFDLGMRYIDAIKQLTDSVGYKIYATPYGTIRAERNIYPAPGVQPNVILYDYVNIATSDFVVDTQDARDTIIIASDTGWEEFENNFLRDWLRPTFRRAAKVTIPWANTPQKRQMAAQSAFAMMMRVTRRLSVASVAHPALEVGDIAQLSERVSTAASIYRITGIKTELSDGMFFDTIELEGVVFAEYVNAVPTNRYFGQASDVWDASHLWLQPNEIRDVFLDMKGPFAEAKISIHSLHDESVVGAVLRLLFVQGSGWNVTSDFSYDELLQRAKPTTEEGPDGEEIIVDPGDPSGLQERGIQTYDDGLNLKKVIESSYGGKLWYISRFGAGVTSTHIAVIHCTTATKTFMNDQIRLRIINITKLAGGEGKNRQVGWKIKSIAF